MDWLNSDSSLLEWQTVQYRAPNSEDPRKVIFLDKRFSPQRMGLPRRCSLCIELQQPHAIGGRFQSAKA